MRFVYAKALLMLVILLPAMFSGCFGEEEIVSEPEVVEPAYPQPWERADFTYDDSDVFSRVTVNGSHGIDTVEVSMSKFLPLPQLTEEQDLLEMQRSILALCFL